MNTMLDYRHFDEHLAKLHRDIYEQPTDPGHTAWATSAAKALCGIPENACTVLDVGCGQGFMSKVFGEMGLEWTGINAHGDYFVCLKAGLDIYASDMTFLPFADREFDIVFARHILEHSPFPLITLMEWRRVCAGWLALIVPAPEYWGIGGRNHYSMLYRDQLQALLDRAGWHAIHEMVMKTDDQEFIEHCLPPIDENGGVASIAVEYRLLCEKAKPRRR